MRSHGYLVDATVKKYRHHYPNGYVADANIYPDAWLPEFRTWFQLHWKTQDLKERDSSSLPSVARLLGLPEGTN
ncbi:MAG: hypothetical protein WBB28_01255 [Crinalium sp.]